MTTEQPATATAIACHRFQSTTSPGPRQLDKLVVKEISALSTNPFTWESLQDRVIDSGWKLRI